MNNKEKMAKIMRSFMEKPFFKTCIGVVIEPPPNLTISIQNGDFKLYPDMLYMNDRLFDDYTRTYKLQGKITNYSFDNTTNTEIASNHTHPIKKLAGKGNYEAEGTFINTDTLKVGDLVKVTPVAKGQMWIVDYKIRKIKEKKQ